MFVFFIIFVTDLYITRPVLGKLFNYSTVEGIKYPTQNIIDVFYSEQVIITKRLIKFYCKWDPKLHKYHTGSSFGSKETNSFCSPWEYFRDVPENDLCSNQFHTVFIGYLFTIQFVKKGVLLNVFLLFRKHLRCEFFTMPFTWCKQMPLCWVNVSIQ